MITWAIVTLVIRKDLWKPEGVGITLLFAMFADVVISYNIGFGLLAGCK